MTIEQVAMMTADEARQATDRIRLALDRVSTAWADLAERVEDAHRRRADLALGYASWNEYAAAELQPPHSLAAEVRRELVGLLSARGMSTRAIAPVAGVTHKTVILDRQVVPDVPPETSDRIDLVTGEVLDATFTIEGETITTPVAPTVTGLDGKTYKRPTQRDLPVSERWDRWDEARDLAAQGVPLVEVHEQLDYPASQKTMWGAATKRGITFPDARRVAKRRRRAAEVLDRATGVIETAAENLHDIVDPADLDDNTRDEAIARLVAARSNLSTFIRTLKDFR